MNISIIVGNVEKRFIKHVYLSTIAGHVVTPYGVSCHNGYLIVGYEMDFRLLFYEFYEYFINIKAKKKNVSVAQKSQAIVSANCN